jgi:hypothetical protein
LNYRRLLSFPGCQEAELGWMVGTNVCLGAGYAVVAPLPRLVEVSGPNGEVAGVAHLFGIRSVMSLGYSKRNVLRSKILASQA